MRPVVYAIFAAAATDMCGQAGRSAAAYVAGFTALGWMLLALRALGKDGDR